MIATITGATRDSIVTTMDAVTSDRSTGRFDNRGVRHNPEIRQDFKTFAPRAKKCREAVEDLRKDYAELRKDRLELRRDIRNGASKGEILQGRREVRNDLKEIAESRRELRQDSAKLDAARRELRSRPPSTAKT